MSSNETAPPTEKPKKKGRIVESRYMSALKTKAPGGTSQTARGTTNKPNTASSSIAGASRTQRNFGKSFAPSSSSSSISASTTLKRNSVYPSSVKTVRLSAKHQGLSNVTTSSTTQKLTSSLSRSSIATSSLAARPKAQLNARKQSLKPTTTTASSSTSVSTTQVSTREVRSRTSSISSIIRSREFLDKAADSKSTRLSSSHSRRPSVGRTSFGRSSLGGSQSKAPESVSSVTLEEDVVLLYSRLLQWWFMNGKAKWEWEMQDENAEEQVLQVYNLLNQKSNQVKELKSLIDQSKLLVQVENVVGTQIRELEPIVARLNCFEQNYKVLSNALLDTISKMGVRNAAIDDLGNFILVYIR
ncbi:hypothetical protein BKA69DRAFT_1092799 [Paraphysoderma sedebokerense]|nr:hypothetical protein BKA69DRAFT_1092799 [Paraphysoderma sedebokerense]